MRERCCDDRVDVTASWLNHVLMDSAHDRRLCLADSSVDAYVDAMLRAAAATEHGLFGPKVRAGHNVRAVTCLAAPGVPRIDLTTSADCKMTPSSVTRRRLGVSDEFVGSLSRHRCRRQRRR